MDAANAAIAELKRLIDGMIQRNVDQAVEIAGLQQAIADHNAKVQTDSPPGPGNAKQPRKEKR